MEGGPSEKDMGLSERDRAMMDTQKGVPKTEDGARGRYSPEKIAAGFKAREDAWREETKQQLRNDYKRHPTYFDGDDGQQLLKRMTDDRQREKQSNELRGRARDVERFTIQKPNEALRAIDRLYTDIDETLNKEARDHRAKQLPADASLIDRQWADAVLEALRELESQIKLEQSISVSAMEKLFQLDPARSQKWVEAKWANKLRAVRLGLGERYIESPDEERQRIAAREQARAEL